MHEFVFRRPKSLGDAIQWFEQGEAPRYLAGGQSLIPMLKQRLAHADPVIDLSGVPGLTGITVDAGHVDIGALTTHADIAAVPDLTGLAALAGGIGDAQVRTVGTLGGALAHADPAADYSAAVLALRATIHTDRRTIAADHFFRDLFQTALVPGEIITHVTFRVPDQAAYRKVRSPGSRYAVVGVMVARSAHGARVAVTGAGPAAFRWQAAEEAIDRGTTLDDLPLDASRFTSDIQATADYRAHLVGILTRRLVAELG